MNRDSEPKALAALFKSALPPLEETGTYRVLDFGCGAGRLVHEMHLLGIEAYGCDIQSYLADDLSVPRDRFAQPSFDPYHLPYPDNFFDAVVSSSVLEHAQNFEEVLHEIKRVLKPGGAVHARLPGLMVPSDRAAHVRPAGQLDVAARAAVVAGSLGSARHTQPSSSRALPRSM